MLCYTPGTSSLAHYNRFSDDISDIVIKANMENRVYAPINGRFQSRDHFVKTLLPHAITAGKTLGVDPKVILAQAALESNWGKSILSHNIFSIKHTSKKSGNSITVKAKEFQNGKALYKKEKFRSYNTYGEAFADYTRIIQKAHYRKHMQNLRTPSDYATSLQRAGYATDPKYAKKIMQKYHDPIFQKSINSYLIN